MSIDRINRLRSINAYNLNCNKTKDKIDKNKKVDTIEISALGKSLKNYALSNSVENAKRVAEIKSKVENRTYSVDARLTANSILTSIKEKNNYDK